MSKKVKPLNMNNEIVLKSSKKSNKKRKNFKRCWGFCDFISTLWELFKEYSADTSIHGIKYLTDKKRHWSERLFWAIALMLSISACFYLIYDSFLRWQQAPVMVSFSEKFMNVWEIPFAAVTICPSGGISVLNPNYNITSNIGTEKPLRNFTGSIEKRITRAIWRKSNKHSVDLFTEIATEEGFCWTFNMLNYDDLFGKDVIFESFSNLKNQTKLPKTQWDLQEGFYSKEPYIYPFRISGSGENGGLSLEIWRSVSEVRNSSNYNKGFKLVVHLPSEIPRFDNQYYRLPLEKSATLILHPSMLVTEGLTNHNHQIRQCFIDGEKKLRFFKTYTKSNCQLECIANYTRERCGCVHYAMPRLIQDYICDTEISKNCCEDVKREMMTATMETSLKNSKSYDDLGIVACDCLPPCTSLHYEAGISHDDIRTFTRSSKRSDSFHSAVTIFFKDDAFIFSKRSELFGFSDLLANFGGLLGLFLGVSILSIVEIIYFMIFRKLDESSRRSSVDESTIASIEVKSDRNGF